MQFIQDTWEANQILARERVLLRHKSLTTTERYLRELEDYTGSLLTTYDVRIE